MYMIVVVVCEEGEEEEEKKKRTNATRRNANPVFDSAVARQMPTEDKTRDWR
jgi:hypothetical protein